MSEYLIAIFELLAGLGVLLVGFKLLSDNIEKLANTGLKRLFGKTSNNRFVGVGIGAAATALIQSSSATTVMVVGFVNAGIMTLFQATSMIMGANIGTTITAQIAAFGVGTLDVGLYASLLAVIGIFMQMLCKKDKWKTTGLALAGLGIVFIGLDLMSGAMKIFAGEGSPIPGILKQINNPLLLLLVGAILTALIQSSSAMTTIVISMVAAGMTFGTDSNSVLYVVLGSNIGTCITAILSSIGASSNAKRASLIHLMFNFFGSLVFFGILLAWPSFFDVTFKAWFKDTPSIQIAMFHTFFNVVCTLIFIPFIKGFVKIATYLIKDKKEAPKTSFIDDRFLMTPSVALGQAAKETLRLGKYSMDTLCLSIDAFLNKNYEINDKIQSNIKNVEHLNAELLSYLVKVSSQNLSDEDEKMISKLHTILNDFYREIEIADNMMKYTRSVLRDDLKFSDSVLKQISLLKDKLVAQFNNIEEMFTENRLELINQVNELEAEIDGMRSLMIKQHITRLENNECSPASSGVFINMVSNLERAGDHLIYVAQALIEQ